MSLSARAVGAGFVLFSALVLAYFTAWTFLAPLSATEPPLVRVALPPFPPRPVLLALPYAGVVGLTALVGAFVALAGRK